MSKITDFTLILCKKYKFHFVSTNGYEVIRKPGGPVQAQVYCTLIGV
ncbi:hypothetical protein MHYMCMPSP_01042 [Hyalomma marginatum]|uniref:Uncharacterized protein n=1 Tax=Hyalomma marginatum TaxID=34627 RepID=A0A8S4BV82_9ACAR|nr:hypothetical protein MHYMCMPASI_00127 [Hyalomma marginatum]CAG7597384.1 hypothetical protein MHYMCMPSP_01042 [Hyalomma marginatum]